MGFSHFGLVVCARIPRRATTREPQSFAFVSYLSQEDARRASKEPYVEVRITPTWAVPLKPRLSRYGQADDKRVAVRAAVSCSDGDVAAEFDWIHVCRK